MRRRTSLAAALLAAAVALVPLVGLPAAGAPDPTARAAAPARASYLPPVGHVFVINIENKGYDATWGDQPGSAYLGETLRRKGVLLNTYYGTAHNSQPNYVAQISGQGPNADMQADCQAYSDFTGTGTADPGQRVGQGCVFPAGTPNLGSQLIARHIPWKAYQQDLPSPCYHPEIGAQDPTQTATAESQYATRHDPFVYFHDLIDDVPRCRTHVVGLQRMRTDLRRASTTPALSYITPDLCHDGHDATCADGGPGGFAGIDAFLRHWVPRILASPAFRADGMLVITADESDGPQSDATACCGEGAGPNSPMPGITGPGGGRIGALVISRWTRPNTWSTTPYNHYSLLASLEDLFDLPHLGYAAADGLNRFGLDVFNR